MRTEVRLMACMSLDGFISRSRGEPPDQEERGGWTSAENRREFWREVRAADVVLAGRNAIGMLPDPGRPVAMLSRQHDVPHDSASVFWVLPPAFYDVREWLDGRAGKRVLVCGGSMTYDFFLRWNLVDILTLVVEPVMLGGGVRLRTPPETKGGMDVCRFSMAGCRPLNPRGTVRLDFRRAKP